MSTRRQVLSLYRRLMRESQKLTSYNFRLYAIRKIRDTFQENRTLKDFAEIDAQILNGEKNLEMIRRQAIISYLYQADKLVLEQGKKKLRSSDD